MSTQKNNTGLFGNRMLPTLKPKLSLTLPKNLPSSSGSKLNTAVTLVAAATAISRPKAATPARSKEDAHDKKKPAFESLRHNYVFSGGHSQKFLDIVEQSKISGRKYTDPDFPPEQLSLCYDPSKIRKDYLKATGWRRAGDFEGAQLFVDGVEPGDIIQGPLGGTIPFLFHSRLLVSRGVERNGHPF
jgi:hypothetical protein